MLAALSDGWHVRPGDGRDVISYAGVTVGEILWVRELRYPAIARIRMSDALNGSRSVPPRRPAWSATRLVAGDDTVWVLSHFYAECAELRWLSLVVATEGVVAGLNMVAGGRPPVACEPLPVARPRLRVVR